MRHMSTMRDKAIVEIAHRILADRPMRMALTGKDKAAVGREGACSLQHFDRLAGERQHEVEARIQLAVELQLHSRRGAPPDRFLWIQAFHFRPPCRSTPALPPRGAR